MQNTYKPARFGRLNLSYLLKYVEKAGVEQALAELRQMLLAEGFRK